MPEVTVCRLDELPEVGAQEFTLDGTRVAVVRIDDDVYAIGAECTHQAVPMAEGDIDAETCHIECWKHGSSFSLVTGEPDALPATRPLAVYAARVDGGSVVVTVP
jgi:3-phenylpropionate/trans-cinnamate dioxygenase ferredoxin component